MNGVGGVDGGTRGALRGLFTFGIKGLRFQEREIVEKLTDGESKEWWTRVLMLC